MLSIFSIEVKKSPNWAFFLTQPTNMYFLQEFNDKVDEFVNEGDLLNYTQLEIPIVFYINLSVLAGEYYSAEPHSEFYPIIDAKLDHLGGSLNKLRQKIKVATLTPIAKPTGSIEGEEVKKQETNPKPKLDKVKELESFLNNVRLLYKKLVRKAERDFKDYGEIQNLYNDYEIFDLDLNVELFRHHYDGTVKPDSEAFEFDIFQINIKLAEVDINLDCADDVISKLTSYKNFLERHQGLSIEFTNLILGILLDKAKFLLYKIFLRRYNHIDDESAEKAYYASQMKDLKKEMRFYLNFLESSDDQYASPKKGVKTELSLKLETNNASFSISELHKLGKNYRTRKSLAGIESLIGKASFVEMVNHTKFGFDEFAKASARNLLHNTKLRVMLELEVENNFKNAIKLLREQKKDEFNAKYFLQAPQGLTSNKAYIDYYPYVQLFKFYEALYDYLIEEPLRILPEDRVAKLKEEGKDLKEDIEKLFKEDGAFCILDKGMDELIQQFRHKLKFCQHKKYKPIYLTYEECKYVVKQEDIKKFVSNKAVESYPICLFAESSYVLPVDYGEINDDWKGVKNKMSRKSGTLKNALKIEYQLRFSEKSFRKEVENKEFKLVQALAMFIAIATLILGSIKATEGRSVLSSILIILGLGSVLMLFNYFIYWFIRVDKSIKWREVILLVLIILIGGSVYWQANTNDEKLKELKIKTDLLELYRQDDIRKSKPDDIQIPQDIVPKGALKDTGQSGK